MPESEFIEFYNNSGENLTIHDWTLSVGNHSVEIPLTNIKPEGYLLITTDYEGFITKNNSIVEISNLPSLPNSGEILTLYNDTHHLMAMVNYSNDWYRDEVKEKGGYSLEIIDPENYSGDASNWKASDNPTGGTPGYINSVNAVNPDHNMPQLNKVIILNEDSLELFFSEPMDSLTLINILNYSVDNAVDNPVFADPVEPFYKNVILTFSENFPSFTIFTIYVSRSAIT